MRLHKPTQFIAIGCKVSKRIHFSSPSYTSDKYVDRTNVPYDIFNLIRLCYNLEYVGEDRWYKVRT